MKDQVQKCDVLIVGSGIAGLTLACALAQQTALNISILESQAPSKAIDSQSPYQSRISAISLASQRILQSLGVWGAVKACRISSFKGIYVWDAAQQASIRFDASEIAAPWLGHIIENQVIHQALHEKAGQFQNIKFYYEQSLKSIFENENKVTCLTEAGLEFEARLVAGADGANSTLRRLAGIQADVKDYDQYALISNVETEKPHQSLAQQVFLAGGPLAFLPLNQNNLCSIVWSLPKEQAQAKLAMAEQPFMQELAEAFAHHLGTVNTISQRYIFPLRQLISESYVKNRIALLGDAAHVVHPLAGQGVNMGFLDAASLAEVMTDALNKQRDFASLATLRRYERWRKADNQGLLLGVDWIKELFASQQYSAQQLRGAGLKLTNQLSPIKKMLVRHAVGQRKLLPALAVNEISR